MASVTIVLDTPTRAQHEIGSYLGLACIGSQDGLDPRTLRCPPVASAQARVTSRSEEELQAQLRVCFPPRKSKL